MNIAALPSRRSFKRSGRGSRCSTLEHRKPQLQDSAEWRYTFGEPGEPYISHVVSLTNLFCFAATLKLTISGVRILRSNFGWQVMWMQVSIDPALYMYPIYCSSLWPMDLIVDFCSPYIMKQSFKIRIVPPCAWSSLPSVAFVPSWTFSPPPFVFCFPGSSSPKCMYSSKLGSEPLNLQSPKFVKLAVLTLLHKIWVRYWRSLF